jgi:hypothetical protein
MMNLTRNKNGIVRTGHAHAFFTNPQLLTEDYTINLTWTNSLSDYKNHAVTSPSSNIN